MSFETVAESTAPASYHWTPALQRAFLDHLAVTGSVQIAASRVSMSPGAAYQLRHRARGVAFRETTVKLPSTGAAPEVTS